MSSLIECKPREDGVLQSSVLEMTREGYAGSHNQRQAADLTSPQDESHTGYTKGSGNHQNRLEYYYEGT